MGRSPFICSERKSGKTKALRAANKWSRNLEPQNPQRTPRKLLEEYVIISFSLFFVIFVLFVVNKAKGLNMSRAFLVHWNKEDALEKAKAVRAEGWTVVYEHGSGEIAFKDIKAKPPDVVIIYLSRLPSHGTRVAEVLQQTKATREIPIVFVDGEPEKVAKVKAKVPNGTFIASAQLKSTLKKFAK
jgi:CheY-like chemotaxis protein